MTPTARIFRPALLALALVLLLPGAAFADEALSGAPGDGALRAVLAVLLGALVLAGVGCLLAVLRVIFPEPTARADRAVQRLGAVRLFLTGILPVLGAGLLGQAAEAGGRPALAAYALLVLLPGALLVLLGAAAAVPHLGAGLLARGAERSLLARSVLAAVVLGLAGGAAAALGREGGLAIFLLLVGGWFLGTGLGAVLAPGADAAGPSRPPEPEGT